MFTKQIAARPFSNYKTLISAKKDTQFNSKLLFFNRGREALIYGLRLLNIEPNSSIIIPSFICNSFVSPLEAAGYKLIFVDINKNLNFDTGIIKKLIENNNKIRAILLVHFFGFFCNIKDVIALCKPYNIITIEDCAHSFLSSIDGIKVGSFGNLSIFSMRKTLPVYDGGALQINTQFQREAVLKIKNRSKIKDLIYLIIRQTELFVTYIGWPGIYSESFVKLKSTLRKFSSKKKKDLKNYNKNDSFIPSYLLSRYLNNEDYLNKTKNNIIKNYDKIISGAVNLGYKPLHKELPLGTIPQWAIIFSNKTGLVEWLRKKGVGAHKWPWDEIPEEVKKNDLNYPNTHYFNDNLVLIPINQSLSLKDCSFILNLLKIWRDY